MDPRLAAVFEGGAVTWSEFHLELARRHRGGDLGKEALEHLIDRCIVEMEASKRGLTIPEEEIGARCHELEAKFEDSGRKLEDHLKKRRMNKVQFREFVRLLLLNERLAAMDLGLPKGAGILPEQVKLWSKDRRKRHEIETDPSKLPADLCLRIGERSLSLRRLGEVMAKSLAREDRDTLLRKMAVHRLLNRLAANSGIEVRPGDIEAEIEKRRKEVREDPRFEGVSLEDLLRAQGRSLSDLRDGEGLRTRVLLTRIATERFPLDRLRKEVEAEPGPWRNRVGPSRRVFRIYFQGRPRRDPRKAKGLCEEIKGRLKNRNTFQSAARRFSEDPGSRKLAGDLGLLHREEPRYSRELLEAAFRLPIGEVSEPVFESEGYSLLFVSEERPGPEGDELLEAVRAYKMGELVRRLVRESRLRFTP